MLQHFSKSLLVPAALSLWIFACTCMVSMTHCSLNKAPPPHHIKSFTSGGRAPSTANKITTPVLKISAKDKSNSEARLTIIQVTDVYTLAHFASLKTLIQKKKQEHPNQKVISILTGDFLAPYLLSAIDKGSGMMNAVAKTPIDYLTWGNHEADIDHRTVCKHVRNYPGKWLNTNMQSHAEMSHQLPYDIVEVASLDGSHTRKVGLVAVLSNDPDLYSSFKAPGAFGGATIDCPWETLRKYKSYLEDVEHVDMVLPLQHTYVKDDHKTCEEFDFPVILSGHDHHQVDEVVNGTRLLKPGLDAIYATCLELTWDSADCGKTPNISATFLKCDDYAPDPALQEECLRAYDALKPLRDSELARVPPPYQPLSSVNSRGSVTTMGKFICSLLRSSLNTVRRQRGATIVDAVLLMGGNIRGGTDYPPNCFFSLEALDAELKPNEVIGVVPMPGWLIEKGILATHAGEPIPGWMQYDEGIREENKVITHIAGEPIDRDRVYHVATKISDLTNGQSPPLTEYFTTYPELLPPKGAYYNMHAELMTFFARNLWRKMWEAIAPDESCSVDDDCDPEGRMQRLDLNGDGEVTIEDIHLALHDLVGLHTDPNEKSLAEFVLNYADTSHNGKITADDMRSFCSEMPEIYDSQKWRLAFPKIKPLVAAKPISSERTSQ